MGSKHILGAYNVTGKVSLMNRVNDKENALKIS